MPLLDPVKDMKIGDKDFKQVILALDIAPMHWNNPRVSTEAPGYAGSVKTGQLPRLSADPS